MARQTAPLPNRSQFIRDQFAKDANATPKTIAAAWQAAGGEEEISPGLVYLIKSKLRAGEGPKTGAKRGRPAASSPVPAEAARPADPTPTSHDAYEAIEAGLDEMIHLSMCLGDSGLAAGLRSARRYVSKHLVG